MKLLQTPKGMASHNDAIYFIELFPSRSKEINFRAYNSGRNVAENRLC